jgi:N6-L-threonylcarbamoyladenine synthase
LFDGPFIRVNYRVLVLGIETSCDDTAAAVVDSESGILSDIVRRQREHEPFGGVVPEIAARAHIEALDAVTERALAEAGVGLEALGAVAATAGPGLIGGVVVGFMYGKGLAASTGRPFYPVHHLEGHALLPRLTAEPSGACLFPYLLFLLSGGHCLILACRGPKDYLVIGRTRDDAVGEAFDKTAKMLGLGYPGGPEVEARAKRGDGAAFSFPEPLKYDKSADMSLSGLKTAVRQTIERYGSLSDALVADVCASFERTVCAMLKRKLKAAFAIYRRMHPDGRRLVLSGGVAANGAVRRTFVEAGEEQGFAVFFPPPSLCTDNGAMIAWAAVEYAKAGLSFPDGGKAFSRGWDAARDLKVN